MFTRFAVVLLFFSLISGTVDAAGSGEVAVIPRPMKVQVREGVFTLTPRTTIVVTEDTHDVGRYLAKQLAPATGFNLDVRQYSQIKGPRNCIFLRVSIKKAALGPEGYELKVFKDRVFIEAGGAAGAFYGCQTLRQLFPSYIESSSRVGGVDWQIPLVHVEDMPRFVWRGALIDSSRYFQNKEYIKKFIDLLAFHKMNRFHWHLTDEQGWRVEIKKYPRLTETGAWQKVEGGEKIGGFYSQDDVREIVRYASRRFVTVVPEIEMPAHAQAALASYPEISCTGGPFEVMPGGGSHPEPSRPHSNNIFCVGNDKTIQFLEDVLTEVTEIFPSPWIHIGGDEARKDFWRDCPKCQRRIKVNKLRNEEELQTYLIAHIEKFLRGKGRKLIGWDEILEGGLAEGAIVQSWQGMYGGIEAANKKHNVIMSPVTHCYVNMPYDAISIAKAYSFDPIPPELAADNAGYVLGTEACMWGEQIPALTVMDYMVFPRLCALAEVAWSPAESKNYDEFARRLKIHGSRLDKLGVNFYRDPAIWPRSERYLFLKSELCK